LAPGIVCQPARSPDKRTRRSLGGSRLTANLPPWLAAIIVSPFVGSFLGVLIRRLPLEQRVMLDRSRCEACGHVLGMRDLLPIGSYLALRGRCRFCGTAIAPFHWAVELAAVAVAVTVALVSPDVPSLWCGCVLGWGLLALAWIDWRHLILPDALTLPLVLLGLGATVWLDPEALADHAAAAALAYLLFRLIAWTYRRLRGRDGLGEGDAKLMAAAGAWVGITALSSVLLGGALLTLLAAVISALRSGGGLSTTVRLPLGPGLCAALWLVWLWPGL
jgi:leader peptidase (prepilin peptidase)/N-methyltransferase